MKYAISVYIFYNCRYLCINYAVSVCILSIIVGVFMK